jgi:hypothetical protein
MGYLGEPVNVAETAFKANDATAAEKKDFIFKLSVGLDVPDCQNEC